MKAIAVQFKHLIHIGGEPIRNIVLGDSRWDSVVVDENGISLVRSGRNFFIPKQNITCIEYAREPVKDISGTVPKGSGQKKQKRSNRSTSKRVTV